MAEQEIVINFNSDTTGFDDGSKRVVKSLDNIKNSSKTATNAMVNFGRVIQDAPYGIIGVANNIDPLVESFKRLKTETGSIGGAFKSLGSSLLGGGGITLAVSLATSALVVFGDKLFSSKKQTDDAADSAKKYAEEINNIKESVAKEAISVERLVKFANDENTSRADRLAAIKKLKDIAPEYFGTLDAEKTSVEQLALAYNNFSSNIQNSIKAKIFGKELEQLTKKRLELEDQVNQKGEEEVVINGKIVKARVVDMRLATKKDKLDLQNKYLEAKLKEEALIQRINDLQKPIDGDKDVANKLAQSRIKAAQDEAKRLKDIQDKAEKERLARLERVKIASEKIDLKGLTVDIKPDKIGDITNLFGKGGNGVLKQIESLQKPLQDLQDRFTAIADSIVNILAPAFTSLFDDILSGSQTAFQAFGQAIAGIIKKLIAAAITAAIFAAIVSVAFPGVATGGASFTKNFGNLFGQLSGLKFADGGIVSGPTRALIGEAGPEAVIPLHKLDSMIGGNQNIFVTGVLSGENIYLQQQRTSARRSRFV